MFQTLGNIATNPIARLLFMDFERGSTLQITGTARVVWEAERVVEFAGPSAWWSLKSSRR